MNQVEKKIEWCLRKAEKEGKKHRGLKEITPDSSRVEDHIKKAEHNLQTMEYLIKGGFTDWAVSTSFYVHYHCLLAILQKFGYESRNQECTFAVIGNLIAKRKISLKKEELDKIFSQEDKLEDSDIITLREFFQYGTDTSYEENKIQELLNQTREFIEKTKVLLQSIK